MNSSTILLAASAFLAVATLVVLGVLVFLIRSRGRTKAAIVMRCGLLAITGGLALATFALYSDAQAWVTAGSAVAIAGAVVTIASVVRNPRVAS
ncbi:hypothetical protein IDM40_15700 [Nocardiopsis sp. HNM0947]|uniref:Uncharacterized protein n=1 Tax=Nocardiopsis coralli TaxID=2772213 RepID=A0ABR9P8J5_9ACTN|nr:hypothetical protein [Nocardiopsis coralli]MBE3000137.1 hypothetical protein [Nocardiopsis coralli]